MTPIPESQALEPPDVTQGVAATILLVDDDEDVRGALRAALASRYRILEAGNGLEALGVLAEHLPELVISDISMPGLDGVSLLREIRSRDLDIPVILVTGDPQLDGAVQAVEYGALRYLTKPVDLSELHRLVEGAIGLRQMAHAKREAYRLTSGGAGTASDFAGQVQRFEQALDTLYLHFQPIWSFSQRRAVGYECLLRCEESTLKSPPDLIRVAEELGRTHEVGRAIRARALAALAEIPDEARLFVNLHYTDLADPELFDPSSAFVARANRFVLEVTERESLEAIANAQEQVARLRELGFRIAMDDLGAGHNGLAAFARLAPEVVKLDMLLVRGVDQEERKHDLVTVMRNYCAKRGMDFIAEGVETEAELQALARIGVDLFQGFLLGRPAPSVKPVVDPLDGRAGWGDDAAA